MCRNCTIKNGPLFTGSQPQQPGSISISRTTIAELLISSLDFLSGPFRDVKNELSLATCRRTSLPLIYNVQHGQYTAERMRNTGRTRWDRPLHVTTHTSKHSLHGHTLLHSDKGWKLSSQRVLTVIVQIQDIQDAWINIWTFMFVMHLGLLIKRLLIKSCVKTQSRMLSDGLLWLVIFYPNVKGNSHR